MAQRIQAHPAFRAGRQIPEVFGDVTVGGFVRHDREYKQCVDRGRLEKDECQVTDGKGRQAGILSGRTCATARASLRAKRRQRALADPYDHGRISGQIHHGRGDDPA